MKKLLLVSALPLFLVSGCATVKDYYYGDGSSQQRSSTIKVKNLPPSDSASGEARPVTVKSTREPAAVERPASRSKELTASEIRVVQHQLKRAGFNPGPIDGVMGEKTKAALRKYQRSRRLAANGSLDSKTLSSLGLKY